MKAIKLTISQQTANYRVPISHVFRETYPLPPYSTVIGMIHFLCDFKEYHPMSVSVQGKSNSSISDFFTRYEFKNGMKFDPKRHQLNADGYGISRGVGHAQLLVDVQLILHIIPKDQTEIDVIYHALKFPREYPSLGRREDLALISDVKVVNLQKKELVNDYESKKYAAYIPLRFLQTDDIGLEDNHGTSLERGTSYDLNEEYQLVKIRKGKFERRWQRIPVLYLSDYTIFEDAVVIIDSDGMPLFPSRDYGTEGKNNE